MIICFPEFDTLRLVVSSGLLPAEILQGEACVGELPHGAIAVETQGKLPKKTATQLSKMGVTSGKAMPVVIERVSCWYQILPLEKSSSDAPLAVQAAVLFEMSTPTDLATLVAEMLRLGNDRQSFRWIRDGDTQKILLRVIGPPYYTLLRALDRLPTESGVPIRAYAENAPRFWVELGYSHPLAEALQVPEGRMVLVGPPRDWLYLAEAPFRDAYEILDFQIPGTPVDWETVPDVPTFEVPLKLVPGNATDAAELWVLRGDAQHSLDDFVRDADERLIQRLRFAVAANENGESRIVLRVAPSKHALPVLNFPGGIGFKPYQKLPNLFLPSGTRLHPQLRRDAVRTLLANDTNRCVWLTPGILGEFTPESIGEEAFRPLEDWVEYQIALAQESLRAWIAAAQFDFQSFQCSDTGSPRPKSPPDERTKKEAAIPVVKMPPESKSTAADSESSLAPVNSENDRSQKLPSSEWQRIRLELQAKFLKNGGALDEPGRKSLWPALARANSGAGDAHEAAVCWLNALWEYDRPPRELVEGWFESEGLGRIEEITPDSFGQYLNNPTPTASEIRRFASVFLALATSPTVPAWLKPRLPEVHRYFESHDAELPIRAAWLVGVRSARLSGNDALGLARVRDRLLQRLIEHGLNAELDLPFFLRNSETSESESLRFIREKTGELHKQIRHWSESAAVAATAFQTKNNAQTAPYIDLLFAYTFARLGESRAGRELMETARIAMSAPTADAKFGIASEFLFRAFRSRLELAFAGKPNAGPLEPELLGELDELFRQNRNVDNSPGKMAYYVVSRMREESRILEPLDRVATYEKLGNIDSEFQKLSVTTGGSELAAEVRRLLKKPVSPDAATANRHRITLLKMALPFAHRAGEAFAVELIQQVPKLLSNGAEGDIDPDSMHKRSFVLDYALFLAAHYDRRDLARTLLDAFLNSLAGIPGDAQFEFVAMVARQCLKTLRRLGMADDAEKLLERLHEELLRGRSLEQWKFQNSSDPKRWTKGLQALLALAGGHLRKRAPDRALPILDMARTELLARSTKLQSKDFTAIAQSYIAATGQGEPEFGLTRISELFQKMNPALVAVTYTTAAFYSRLHLNLVEETVLAIVGDDSAFGATGQRWLEDDEYLVRRQIHRDMKWFLHHTGA